MTDRSYLRYSPRSQLDSTKRTAPAAIFAWLLCIGALLAAAKVAAAPADDPQAEYNALLALSRAQLPAALRSDEDAKISWIQQRKTELHGRGATFLKQHSTHPLRWDVLVLLRYGGEDRLKISRSGFRQLFPIPESKAAWDTKYCADLESLLTAPDASASARSEALYQLIDHTARSALSVPAEIPDAIKQVRTWLDHYEREFPRSNYIVSLYHTYTNLLDAGAPDLCLRFLTEIESRYRQGEYLDKQVQELVAGHRRALEAQALPLDELWQHLRGFDAVHGDPDRYRGKVVLVAFQPVTYEASMEALEDLHSKYSEHGLIILQVASFNRAYGLPPEPEQRRDLEKVLAVRKWPWPILWNPEGHMNLVSKWGYNTIPARMLIGRDGRLIPDRNSPYSVTIPRELARSPDSEAKSR
jgi:hypothetical protein